MNITIKEFRLHLSEYLNRASRGHTVKISMRGKPIVVLTRLESKASTDGDALFGLWADRTELIAVEDDIRSVREGRVF